MATDSDLIQQILGDQYAMFYCANFDWRNLVPMRTLASCVDTVNQALHQYGRQLKSWPLGPAYKAAQLVRASVIYQNLHKEFIRKPFLCYRQQNQWILNSGDTRLMALTQAQDSRSVSVLITCVISDIDQYRDYTRILSTEQLIRYTGFSIDTTTVLATASAPGSPYAMSWFEIGDDSTAHHLHDFEQRIQMMQNYLDQKPVDFRFDQSWLAQQISWK